MYVEYDSSSRALSHMFAVWWQMLLRAEVGPSAGLAFWRSAQVGRTAGRDAEGRITLALLRQLVQASHGLQSIKGILMGVATEAQRVNRFHSSFLRSVYMLRRALKRLIL